MKQEIQAVNENTINKKSFKQSGASLMEALLWMAIALIVAGIATAMLKGAFSGSDTLKSGNETKALISGTKSATGGGANYGTVSLNSGLIAGGLVPATLTVAGAVISNSFGGTVTVMGATSTFTLTETNLPMAVCVRKLSSLDPSIITLTVNGAAALTPPVSLATASGATGCNAAANTIVYTAS